MVTPTVGFIVYGVHRNGLKDPMGGTSCRRGHHPEVQADTEGPKYSLGRARCRGCLQGGSAGGPSENEG